jgi:hypothetical protein
VEHTLEPKKPLAQSNNRPKLEPNIEREEKESKGMKRKGMQREKRKEREKKVRKNEWDHKRKIES